MLVKLKVINKNRTKFRRHMYVKWSNILINISNLINVDIVISVWRRARCVSAAFNTLFEKKSLNCCLDLSYTIRKDTCVH